MVQRSRTAVTNWEGGGTGYYISRYISKAILSKHGCPYGFCHQSLLILGHHIPKDISHRTSGKETLASYPELKKTGHVKSSSPSKEIYHHVDVVLRDREVWGHFLLFALFDRVGVVWMLGWGAWEKTSKRITRGWVFTCSSQSLAHQKMG